MGKSCNLMQVMSCHTMIARFLLTVVPITAIVTLSCVGCKTLPGKLIVVKSTYSDPVVPTDPKSIHKITIYYILQNVGETPLQVQRLRTSSSSSMTSDPIVPCDINPGESIRVAFTATTNDQKVTRHAWVETSSDRVELKVTVDPQKMRAASEAAKSSKE